MRRLTAALLALASVVLAVPAAAQTSDPKRVVGVIKVEGLLDDVLVDFVEDALREAAAADLEALVIQLDSDGSVVSQRDLDALSLRVSKSPVPVAVWVGESGARAYEGAFQLLRAAGIAGVAPGVRLGRAPAPVFASTPQPLRNRTISGTQALEQGVVEINAPVLPAFIAELDGRRVGGTVLETAEPGTDDEGKPTRLPTVVTTFSQPSLVAQLLHGVSTPSVAYLLLISGLLLLVFEFFTAGIGVAAGVGVISLVLAAFGLGALPTRPSSLLLVALGVLGFSIDVQAGAPRAWTVIGTIALVVGSLRLFDGLTIPLLTLAAVVGGVALLMVSGMPAMVRTRFSTPTIGREAMIGELGTALVDVKPEGTVQVRGASWRARTNRATPIPAGEPVRVVAIDGLLLEVEPEEGGARDAGH